MLFLPLKKCSFDDIAFSVFFATRVYLWVSVGINKWKLKIQIVSIMKRQWFFFIVIASLMMCLAWSCGNNAKRIKHVDTVSDTAAECSCPHCRLIIQPYGDFSKARAEVVAKELEKNLATYVKDLAVTEIQVLPGKPLTEDLMNDAKTRYRASKILDKQASLKSQKYDAIIGLTDKDISTSAHGYDDWGILGLSYMGHSNCVISTFRVKDKSQFWKVVLHEFGHAYLGLDHCPNNDPQCFMVDCNGKPDLARERYLCDTCSKSIRL